MQHTTNSQSDDRVTLAEAARTVGKAATTIRRLVDLGTLSTTRDETGKHYVRRQDVINHYAVRAHTANSQPVTADRGPRSGASASSSQSVASATSGEIGRLTATIEGQQAQIVLLRDMLERERASVEDLRKQVAAFERERAQQIAEMRALVEGKTGLLSLKRLVATVKSWS